MTRNCPAVFSPLSFLFPYAQNKTQLVVPVSPWQCQCPPISWMRWELRWFQGQTSQIPSPPLSTHCIATSINKNKQVLSSSNNNTDWYTLLLLLQRCISSRTSSSSSAFPLLFSSLIAPTHSQALAPHTSSFFIYIIIIIN